MPSLTNHNSPGRSASTRSLAGPWTPPITLLPKAVVPPGHGPRLCCTPGASSLPVTTLYPATGGGKPQTPKVRQMPAPTTTTPHGAFPLSQAHLPFLDDHDSQDRPT